jgi:hypothetical protein
MANNCLVTKLKGTVDNDNLDIFGFITAKITNGPVLRLNINGNYSGKTFKVDGELNFVSDVSGTTVLGKTLSGANGNNMIYISTGTGKFYIPKYNETLYLEMLSEYNTTETNSRISFNIADLFKFNNSNIERINIGVTSLTSVISPNIYGNIDEIPVKASIIQLRGAKELTGSIENLIDTSITKIINTQGTKFSMNLSIIENCQSLSNIGLGYLTTGNITSIAKNVALDGGLINADDHTIGITGNFVTEFIPAAIAARQDAGGDGSGSIHFAWPRVKLPSVVWPNDIPSNPTIIWDAQGNISYS